MPLSALTQLAGKRLSVDCRVKPGVAGVHQIVAKPGAALVMWSVGRRPAVCRENGVLIRTVASSRMNEAGGP